MLSLYAYSLILQVFVIWFLNLLHFVFKVFDHLTIILNSFSGSLPISCSCIWTSVFLLCSFIYIVFLCLFIIIIIINFFTYCVWALLFPGFKFVFLLLLVFALWRKGWLSSLCWLLIRGDLCLCSSGRKWVSFFFLWWAGLCKVVYFWVSMGLLSVDDCFCLAFSLGKVSWSVCCQ